MGSSNPLPLSSRPPGRSPTPLTQPVGCLGRGDEAARWRHHQRRRRRRGHQWPRGRARGGCGGPGRPAADPRGRSSPCCSPCTAVWGPSAHRGACVGANKFVAPGRLWGRQGGPGGGRPPLPPLRAPGGGSLTTVGGVQHLTGLALGVRHGHRDPSRSSRRSRIALGGPEDDVVERSGRPGGPGRPPPRRFCPPRAPAGRRRPPQESPQQRCSPPRGPFGGLADALGAPAAALDALFGVQRVPYRRRRRGSGRRWRRCTPRKRAFFLQRPPYAVGVARGSAPSGAVCRRSARAT